MFFMPIQFQRRNIKNEVRRAERSSLPLHDESDIFIINRLERDLVLAFLK